MHWIIPTLKQFEHCQGKEIHIDNLTGEQVKNIWDFGVSFLLVCNTLCVLCFGLIRRWSSNDYELEKIVPLNTNRQNLFQSLISLELPCCKNFLCASIHYTLKVPAASGLVKLANIIEGGYWMTMSWRKGSCEYQMASSRGMRGVRGIGLGQGW